MNPESQYFYKVLTLATNLAVSCRSAVVLAWLPKHTTICASSLSQCGQWAASIAADYAASMCRMSLTPILNSIKDQKNKTFPRVINEHIFSQAKVATVDVQTTGESGEEDLSEDN